MKPKKKRRPLAQLNLKKQELHSVKDLHSEDQLSAEERLEAEDQKVTLLEETSLLD